MASRGCFSNSRSASHISVIAPSTIVNSVPAAVVELGPCTNPAVIFRSGTVATLGINDRARALDETDILNVGIESRMPFGIVGLHMYTFVLSWLVYYCLIEQTRASLSLE